jgi:hypothetical protein
MTSPNSKYKHIEFVVTLHCKICGDVSSLQITLSHNEASEKLSEYIATHRHEAGMWVV